MKNAASIGIAASFLAQAGILRYWCVTEFPQGSSRVPQAESIAYRNSLPTGEENHSPSSRMLWTTQGSSYWQPHWCRPNSYRSLALSQLPLPRLAKLELPVKTEALQCGRRQENKKISNCSGSGSAVDRQQLASNQTPS